MPEPIGGRGKLKRHKCKVASMIEGKLWRVFCNRGFCREMRKNRVQSLLVHQCGQEIVDQHPLVVETQRALSVGKAQILFVDEAVVKAKKERLQLADERVFVVAGIADDGPGGLSSRDIRTVTRQILRGRLDRWRARQVLAQQEFRPV